MFGNPIPRILSLLPTSKADTTKIVYFQMQCKNKRDILYYAVHQMLSWSMFLSLNYSTYT